VGNASPVLPYIGATELRPPEGPHIPCVSSRGIPIFDRDLLPAINKIVAITANSGNKQFSPQQVIKIHQIPLVPHKAVAKVSKIGNL
jgi:hypothetical protein